jgi:hypothetical protein
VTLCMMQVLIMYKVGLIHILSECFLLPFWLVFLIDHSHSKIFKLPLNHVTQTALAWVPTCRKPVSWLISKVVK